MENVTVVSIASTSNANWSSKAENDDILYDDAIVKLFQNDTELVNDSDLSSLTPTTERTQILNVFGKPL